MEKRRILAAVILTLFLSVMIGTFVEQVSAAEEGGSTDMMGGIRDGLSMDPTHLILLGDGAPTTSSREDIYKVLDQANPDRKLMVSTVGVGKGHDHVFMGKIAMEHGGFYIAH